jgi:bifunctional non-homologous end joining protein LigD
MARGVGDEQGASQRDEADVGGGSDLNRLGIVDLPQRSSRGVSGFLDPFDLSFGFLFPPMHEQPAGTLGQVLAHEENDDAEYGTGQECHPPRVTCREIVLDQEGDDGAEEGTAPVGPVHCDVHSTAVLGRNELVDGRIDGGVLAADAHARHEAGDPEPVDPTLGMAGRQGGEKSSEEIDPQGDHEQVPAPPLVGETAEEEGTGYLAQEVHGADGKGDVTRRQVEGLRLADQRADVTGDDDFQAVQYPGHAERHHQLGMKARPPQSIQTGWNETANRCWRLWSRLSFCLSIPDRHGRHFSTPCFAELLYSLGTAPLTGFVGISAPRPRFAGGATVSAREWCGGDTLGRGRDSPGPSGSDVVPRQETRVAVGDRELTLSNLDKVLFPESGFTKGQLIDYYAKVAPVMLPQIEDRPLTMKRYPDGVEKKFFYEKHVPSHAPGWVRTAAVPTGDDGEVVDYVVVGDLPALVWAANLGTIEFHVPLWRVGKRRRLPAPPDLIVFDLDPGDGATLVECCEVALLVDEVLHSRGFDTRAKTSGSKGLQVYAPLGGRPTWDRSRADAHEVATTLEKEHPALVISNMKKALRRNKVLIDWSQNHPSKTTIGAYSVRGRARPTVSTPVTWEEVRLCAESGDPTTLEFTTADVLARIDEHGDLFAF